MTKDTSKLAIWEALGKTDPAHTKQFLRAGGFRGTAIKPMWANKRMTEYFGPCGIGWGMDKPEFTLVEAAGEILVYSTVCLWYVTPDRPNHRNSVFGVGGDKVVSQVFLKDGKGQKIIDEAKGGYKTYPQTDDEAYKKAYTDALSNAMKMIGVGADVHMGLFDDSKYVQEVRGEFEDAAKAAVEAEVERQKGPQAPQDAPQAILPPELDWEPPSKSGVMICRILNAKMHKTSGPKGREFLILTINGKVSGVDALFYWHATHRDWLLQSIGRVVKLSVVVKDTTKGPKPNVEEIHEIDGVRVETKEVPPVAGIKPIGDPETQARLLASVLDIVEDDLQGLLKLSKNNWQNALEFLQREQARREVTA